jgi:hypothetical protein
MLRRYAYGLALALLLGTGLVVALRHADAAPAQARPVRTEDRASRGEVRTTPVPTPTATAAPAPPPPPDPCAAWRGNRHTACTLLPQFGFTLSQMTALDPMWEHESGWDHTAANPSSGAYGIPQALPGSKMASVGADWRTNPATQISWGLRYIKERYGTPAAAWSFWQSHGWY